jgi:hypothetical protein
MRNISFSLTTPQMYAGTKTVTRRLGWNFLKAGDILMACEKCQGLRKDEKIKRIYPIEIINVRKERLCNITDDEVAKEGFQGLNADWFVDMFCKANKCRPFDFVNRVEFRKLWKTV